MQVFGPLLLLFVAGLLLLKKYDTEMWGIVISLITGLALFGCGLAAVTNHASVQADLAAMYQLRSAAERVDLQASEDVLGKVVDFNTSLASLKWYNNQWWADPFIPDVWNDVEFIEVNKH